MWRACVLEPKGTLSGAIEFKRAIGLVVMMPASKAVMPRFDSLVARQLHSVEFRVRFGALQAPEAGSSPARCTRLTRAGAGRPRTLATVSVGRTQAGVVNEPVVDCDEPVRKAQHGTAAPVAETD